MLGEKEILTLKKIVEPTGYERRLKEEEISFIRNQIEQKEEEASIAVEEKEDLQEETPKVTDEIKTGDLETEKEILVRPVTESHEELAKGGKLETEVEKEIVEKSPEKVKLPKKGKKRFKAKLETPVIEDVKIVKIENLWRKKPKLFSSESDAIIVTIKTPEKERVKETFYAYIKPNGTFDIKSGRTKTPTQQRFVSFLRHYNLTDTLEGYDITEKIEEWKGKAVELDGNSRIVIK